LTRKLLAVVLTLVLAGWLLQGCGPSGGEMTPATASTLQRDVDAVVSAPPTPPVGTLPSTRWIN
jgi:hypothetical protein